MSTRSIGALITWVKLDSAIVRSAVAMAFTREMEPDSATLVRPT
jgi:hypothetical protein